MMGMIRAKRDSEIGTAWKVVIAFAVLFIIASTIEDMRQSRKLTELEHRIEMITVGQESHEQEDRIRTYESMADRLGKINAKLDALEQKRKEGER